MMQIILLFAFFASPSSHAITAKELYFKCIKSELPNENFRLCVGRELKSDRSGLRQDFERRWKEQQAFLRSKDDSLTARKCQASHLEFRKTRNQDLWSVFSCSRGGECTELSQVLGLQLTEAQQDEIYAEFKNVKNHKWLGLEFQTTSIPHDALSKSCKLKQGMCHKVFKKLVGFSPVLDESFGIGGAKNTRLEPSQGDLVQGKGAQYLIENKIRFTFPKKILVDRSTEIFSNRGTSFLANWIDKMQSEEEMRLWIFNTHLTSLLSEKLRKEMNSFSFTFHNTKGICADEVFQLNRTRRGMSIQEALLFRKKDESQDLAHSIGGALKAVGGGFTRVVTGFLKDQVGP